MKATELHAAFWMAPWAILPSWLAEMRAALAEDRPAKPAPEARIPGGGPAQGKVALVRIVGPITQHDGFMSEFFGGVSTDAIGAALDYLGASKAVRTIVLAFDSPGGSVFGVGELADKIRGLRAEKKVVGIADSVSASAAYWLLSQCAEINVTPGGQVGSIGVLAAHEDMSQALQQGGVKTTLVSAGKYKAEGSPYGPLDDEARAELQSKVDHYYSQFVAAVARGRGVTEARVNADFGQGRMMTAKAAVACGAADHVATLEQVLRRCGAGDGQAGPGANDLGIGVTAKQAAYRARALEVETDSK